jgi:predicted RNase H-like HicB family nuclease
MEIEFTTQIFREGRTYVAHTPELDVSSCGGTKEKALKNLKEAVRLFLEDAETLKPETLAFGVVLLLLAHC